MHHPFYTWTNNPVAPPAQSAPTRGGLGGQYHNFDTSRRRKRKDEEKWIRSELISAYEAISKEASAPVVAEVVQRLEQIKAIPVRPARKRLPQVRTVDWQKVLVDQVTIAVIKRLVEEIHEEEEILLLS